MVPKGWFWKTSPAMLKKGYKFEKTFKNCEKVYLSDFNDIFTGK